MRDDAELLRHYSSRRDEAAFAELVLRHLDVVYFAALRRCRGDSHLAEEITQRVFTVLARDAAKLHRHAVLAGWLYVTTRNVAANLLRDEKTRYTREAEAWAMSKEGEAAETVNWDRLRPVLDDVMDKLEDRDRDAILLRYFQDRPFAEIGAKLHLTEDAARMRVSRALDKLRALLIRRGVASTSAALAIALAGQGAIAKPAGLAASVTTAALASTASVTAAAFGVTVLSFMSTAKLSIGTTLALVALLASLSGNAYLLTQQTAVNMTSPKPAATRSDRQEEVVASVLDPNSLVKTGDLGVLRDQLRAEGASDDAVRSIIEGMLRRRYREKLSQDRAARYARGWWKDVQRTWGTAESSQRLSDDPALLRSIVTDPLERLLGPDPVETAEADAKYAFLPAELRQRLGRIDRALETDWSRAGALANDEALRTDYEKVRRSLEAERAALLASLPSDQRESYEMRFSQTSTTLARQVDPLETTEQEFTTVYPLANQYAKNALPLERQQMREHIPPWLSQERRELDRRYAQQLIETLGYDRALNFIWSGAEEYSSYDRVAREAGLAPGTAGRVLQLKAETSERAAAIHADPTQNLEQKTAALAILQQSARSELNNLVPPSAQQQLPPPAVEWIESLSQGRYKQGLMAGLPGLGLKVIDPTIALSSPPPTNRLPPTVPPRTNGR